jgi:hypothetical protein
MFPMFAVAMGRAKVTPFPLLERRGALKRTCQRASAPERKPRLATSVSDEILFVSNKGEGLLSTHCDRSMIWT